MKNKLWIGLALLFILPGHVYFISCAGKTIEDEPSLSQVSEDEAARQKEEEESRLAEIKRQEELEQQRILEEERLREASAKAERDMADAMNLFENEDIYFSKGSYSLSSAAQALLEKKAGWLKTNPEISVIIQGHTDEPGTAEYNLAFGARRGGEVKSFLIKMGISPSRLTVVSYGKECPSYKSRSEESKRKNRRVHFVIE
ncbi:MAG: OmpA family protein [Thermodesulfobacteriota bacterium]|nr:OmpA family protein [Thermodesulfobacteriota bacterium]